MTESKRAKVKVITIAVTYDPANDPDPAEWDWAELAGEWGNGPANLEADIKLLTDDGAALLEAEYGEGMWVNNARLVVDSDGNVAAEIEDGQE